MGIFNSRASCYCLALALPASIRLEVGALGTIQCPSGWIYYAGRSSSGWTTRLKRFTAEDQTNFWHIDYLVNNTGTVLKAILPVNLSAESECELASYLESLDGFTPLSKKFGASDCSAGCSAHAWTTKNPPEAVFEELKKANYPINNWIEFKPRMCSMKTVKKSEGKS